MSLDFTSIYIAFVCYIFIFIAIIYVIATRPKYTMEILVFLVFFAFPLSGPIIINIFDPNITLTYEEKKLKEQKKKDEDAKREKIKKQETQEARNQAQLKLQQQNELNKTTDTVAVNTPMNMDKITAELKTLNMQWQITADNICTTDNYCTITINGTRINAINNNVYILYLTQSATESYQSICAIVLTGLTQLPSEQAHKYIAESFNTAAKSGNATLKNFAGVDFMVSQNSNKQLLCKFITHTQ